MKQKALAWLLVVAQFALIAALALVPRGELWPVDALALAVAGLLGVAAIVIGFAGARGLGGALTPSPIPREEGALVTTGAYGLLRHPIYTALLILALALLVSGAAWWHIGLFIALLAVLMAKARWEERMLLARHPGYRAYAARVGRFLPGVGRIRRSGD